MDIYETWKTYKEKIEKELVSFNEAVKTNDLAQMRKSKDVAKN
jgi:hypothetical protein